VGEVMPLAASPGAPQTSLRAEAFACCDPLAADCGVRICVENVQLRPNEVITSFTDHVRLIDTLAHPAVVCALDTGHAHVSGGIRTGIEIFGPRLQHIHLHDNHGEKDEHLEVGKGTIQFAKLSGFLANFHDLISLETRSATDPHGAVLRSRARIERLWPQQTP
jgi:sugar phosphate isomerase/epimerase